MSGVIPGTRSGVMGVPDGKVCVAVMGITDGGFVGNVGNAFFFGTETGTDGTDVSFGAAATGTDALGVAVGITVGAVWLNTVIVPKPRRPISVLSWGSKISSYSQLIGSSG